MAERLDLEVSGRLRHCRELLDEANRQFREYLGGGAPNAPEYYRARNLLREGKTALEEALRTLRRVLGPVPAYAAKDFEAMRAKTQEDLRLILHGGTPDELKAELAADPTLDGIVGRDEAAAFVDAHFEAQRTGNRRLRNFKARLIVDRLRLLIKEGEELQRRAAAKQMGG